jgi:hypothetical protein
MTRSSLGVAALVALLGTAGCGENLFSNQPVSPGDGSGIIRGQARAATGVAGARIIIIDGPETFTDSQGQYRFAGVASGAYRLSIGVPQGFQLAPGDSATRGATVTSGRETVVNWQLVQSGPGL